MILDSSTVIFSSNDFVLTTTLFVALLVVMLSHDIASAFKFLRMSVLEEISHFLASLNFAEEALPLSMLFSSVIFSLAFASTLLFDCGGVALSLPQSISDGASVSLETSVAGDDEIEFIIGFVNNFEIKSLGVTRPSNEAHESGLGHNGDGV